ncbi:MAG TPA: FmdE family protein [Blastocatellia bacterium]|nr:FmdE family protein [Blastocatellia bacterium]
MESLDELIEQAAKAHGHLCPGQILGLRMGILGCRLVGVEDPKKEKSLIVCVEIDRCATDALSVVTGCRLGKRTLKFFDYGKVAATFINTRTGCAYRVVARDSSRVLADELFSHLPTKKDRQMAAYRTLPDDELFTYERVRIALSPEDLPGRPRSRVFCARCGEGVNDHREVVVNGQPLCRACAGNAYYEKIPPSVD